MKEKFRCCIPPSSVNSGSLPLKLRILVGNILLHVSVPKKRKIFTSNVAFGLVIYSPEKVCVLWGNHPRFTFCCRFILGRHYYHEIGGINGLRM